MSFFEMLSNVLSNPVFYAVALGLSKVLLPMLAFLIVTFCTMSLFAIKNEDEKWGGLVLPNGEEVPLLHWENLIGRAKDCDVVIDENTVSRKHAVIIRDSKGKWVLHPLNSKNGILLNCHSVTEPTEINARDIIQFGGVSTNFLPYTREQERRQASVRIKPGKDCPPALIIFLLSLFQALLAVTVFNVVDMEYKLAVLMSYSLLFVITWCLYVIYRIFKRTSYELETLAFFLSTICITVTSIASPSGVLKQTFCLLMGVVLFFTMSIILRNPEFVKKMRWYLAILSVILLIFNVLFGARIFGAKNWISIGSISFQPSEFVKIIFILAGAVTLEKMFSMKNLVTTLIYSAICVGCLGLMGDFGTALIFFVALLAIVFLRSGNLYSVLLMLLAAFSGGFLILQYKSYILARFAVYRHVWEDASNMGYQQTRTMSAIANGGLFGKGVGNGWLVNVGASQTDLVFGVVSEELGLIIAVLMVISVAVIALFAIVEANNARSSFFVIIACSSAMIFIVQTMLNVFGSTDILPLTGVTFPFVSVGGSSMMSCWTLLAYIKASDTRQNSTISVKLPNKKNKNSDVDEPTSWKVRTGFVKLDPVDYQNTKVINNSNSEQSERVNNSNKANNANRANNDNVDTSDPDNWLEHFSKSNPEEWSDKD